MNLNKKGGMFIIFASIIFLSFFSFFFLFFGNLMFEVGDDYMMETVENVSLQIAEAQNLTEGYVTIITDARTNYTETAQSVPYDLYFFIGLVILFSSNIGTSLGTRKYGYFSFFGFVSVGIMFFMGLITILEQVREYLMNNFFYAIFGNPAISTPFIDWFNMNLPFISFFWIVIMLLINQFDTTLLNRNIGREEI